jgi:hypothetical protein
MSPSVFAIFISANINTKSFYHCPGFATLSAGSVASTLGSSTGLALELRSLAKGFESFLITIIDISRLESLRQLPSSENNGPVNHYAFISINNPT